VTAASEDGLAAEAGVAVSVASRVTVSAGGLTEGAGAAAACFAECVGAWAEGRIGWTVAGVEASTGAALTVSADGMTDAAGTPASTTGGVLTVAADGTLVSVGAAASTAGMLAVAKDGLAVAAGTVASAAGVLTLADGLAGAGGVFATGVLAAVAAAAGALTVVPGDGPPVVTGGAAVAAGATAVVAQCSEITFSSVTAKLLLAAPKLAVSLVLCPIRLTSWPRYNLRSTLLVLILRV
jgi:hypothetical protein